MLKWVSHAAYAGLKLGDCNRSRRQSNMQSNIGSSEQFVCDEARARSVQRVRIGRACSARKSVAQC